MNSVSHVPIQWSGLPSWGPHPRPAAKRRRGKHLWALKTEVGSPSQIVGKAPDVGESSDGAGQKAQHNPSGIIANSQKVGTTQIPISGRVDKQHTVYS